MLISSDIENKSLPDLEKVIHSCQTAIDTELKITNEVVQVIHSLNDNFYVQFFVSSKCDKVVLSFVHTILKFVRVRELFPEH